MEKLWIESIGFGVQINGNSIRYTHLRHDRSDFYANDFVQLKLMKCQWNNLENGHYFAAVNLNLL